MDQIEQAFISLNLLTPQSRFLATFSVLAGLEWILQPEAMFAGGLARPLRAAPESPVPPTPTPWWLLPLLSGTAVATLV